MSNKTDFSVKTALAHLGIVYKELPCGSGDLIYCKIPTNGYSFDLQHNQDNVIRLWRFIGTAPVSQRGKHYEYKKTNDFYTVIGIEVTDEGDISFYAEQKIKDTEPNKQERITRMIEGYVSMIANMKLNSTQF